MMAKEKNVYLWRCDLTLHDYLFFATSRCVHMRETGEFIHNYSLTYALGWAKSDWFSEGQKPQYERQLGDTDGIYLTPGQMLTGDHKIMSYRSDAEGYMSSAISGSGYNVIRCLRPGSIFRFYVISISQIEDIPAIIRLGKFMAKAKIVTESPKKVDAAEGDCIIPALLNWNDMATKPLLCDEILFVPAGRLIRNARFSGIRYLRAEFADGKTTILPLDMGYCGRNLCSEWLSDAA